MTSLWLSIVGPPPIPGFPSIPTHDCGVDTVQNEAVRLTYCKVIVDTLPVANRTLLFALLPFLASVMKFADVNKMAVHNIATGE